MLVYDAHRHARHHRTDRGHGHPARVPGGGDDAVAPDRREAWVAEQVEKGIDVLKLQSSLAVEGELPEDGLAAYGDDGDDLMLALARKIVNGEEDEAETVEAVFRGCRGRRVHRRRAAGGTTAGRPWTLSRRPSSPVPDSGPHDEAPEPQQTLFS